MIEIPNTFEDENEDYLTLVSLRDFVSKNKSKYYRIMDNRKDLVDGIKKYANENQENEKKVKLWIDKVAKEGIKDIYINAIHIPEEKQVLLSNETFVQKELNPFVYNRSEPYICNNKYDETLCLVSYNYEHNTYGIVISFCFCKMIYVYDKNKPPKASIYPIFVDLYVDKNIIVGRAKSKSCMYPYSKTGLNTTVLPKQTKTESEIKAAIYETLKFFKLFKEPKDDGIKYFKSQLYKLLNKYTYTPKIIQDMIDDKMVLINGTISSVLNDICKIENKYEEDVRYDVTNLVEKYLSISYPDKSIFTKNRQAYPLKVNATDEEESRVEQTAPEEEPLQSKAVFFDNKKMIQKSGLCDSIKFCFNRVDYKYTGKTFLVTMAVKNDDCCIKSREYIREEDILNVLFSIIDA